MALIRALSGGVSGKKVFDDTLTGTSVDMQVETVDVGFAPSSLIFSRDDGYCIIYDVNYSSSSVRYFKGTSENGVVYSLPSSTQFIRDISGSVITYINRAPYVIHVVAVE